MNGSPSEALRRQEIRRELDALEARMAGVVRRVEADVRSRFTLSHYIKHHTVATFVASTLSGLVISALLGRRESERLLKRVTRSLLSQWVHRAIMRIVEKRA